MCVGGHENWIQNMKKEFPEWIYMTETTSGIKTEQIIQMDYVIINTEHLNHGLYHSALNGMHQKTKLIYVHKTNVGRVAAEILEHL